MGELTASIAHEVTQPLMAIVTSAEACLRWLAKDQIDLEEARSAAKLIIDNGLRAGDVIKNVLALARKSPPDFAEIEVNGVIEKVLELMQAELNRQDVLVETDLAINLSVIHGDKVQLQQVVMDLHRECC